MKFFLKNMNNADIIDGEESFSADINTFKESLG
jgi:hypothetical protein